MCLGMSKDSRVEYKVSIVTLKAPSLISANQNHSLLWLMLQENFFHHGITCNLPPKVFLAASGLLAKTGGSWLPKTSSHTNSQLRFCPSESIHILSFSQVFDQKLHSTFFKKRLSPAQMQQSRKPRFSPRQGFKVQMSESMSPWAPKNPS